MSEDLPVTSPVAFPETVCLLGRFPVINYIKIALKETHPRRCYQHTLMINHFMMKNQQ